MGFGIVSSGAAMDESTLTSASGFAAIKVANYPQWKLLETLTFAADTTKTSAATLTGFSTLKLVIDLKGSAAGTKDTLVLNGDGGAHYDYLQLGTTGAITWVTGAAAYTIQTLNSASGQQAHTEIIFPQNSTLNGIAGFTNCGAMTSQLGSIGFAWNAGVAANVTSITIAASTGNLTGTVKIYGWV